MRTTIIGIAGGTASGKTTVAQRLFDRTIDYGSVTLIRMDDYYNLPTKIVLTKDGNKNFDHPDSYDIELLITHLEDLKKGNSIVKPIYDFVNSTRMAKTETIYPCDVVIVEGIMTFASKELRDVFDMKFFVDTPDDIRFIRRLTRDISERGRTIDSIVNQYLKTVRPMHIAFVEPSKRYADIIVPEGGKNDVAIDVIVTKIKNIIKNNQKAHSVV